MLNYGKGVAPLTVLPPCGPSKAGNDAGLKLSLPTNQRGVVGIVKAWPEPQAPGVSSTPPLTYPKTDHLGVVLLARGGASEYPTRRVCRMVAFYTRVATGDPALRSRYRTTSTSLLLGRPRPPLLLPAQSGQSRKGAEFCSWTYLTVEELYLQFERVMVRLLIFRIDMKPSGMPSPG